MMPVQFCSTRFANHSAGSSPPMGPVGQTNSNVASGGKYWDRSASAAVCSPTVRGVGHAHSTRGAPSISLTLVGHARAKRTTFRGTLGATFGEITAHVSPNNPVLWQFCGRSGCHLGKTEPVVKAGAGASDRETPRDGVATLSRNNAGTRFAREPSYELPPTWGLPNPTSTTSRSKHGCAALVVGLLWSVGCLRMLKLMTM